MRVRKTAANIKEATDLNRTRLSIRHRNRRNKTIPKTQIKTISLFFIYHQALINAISLRVAALRSAFQQNDANQKPTTKQNLLTLLKMIKNPALISLYDDKNITWIPVVAETDEEIKQCIQDDCILVCQANGKTFFKKPA
jgi:hypothetical protein